MFFLKIFFYSCIMIVCSSLGYLYSSNYVKRLENLVYLKGAIKVLETEIVYGATPLPEALLNVYKKSNPKISQIFKDIESDLRNNKRGLALNSFLFVEEKMYKDYFFKKEEIEVFMDLGRVIGSSDRKDQEKNFILVLDQIERLVEEARYERDKNEKMYRNLGVLSGLGIIIILL